MKYDYKYHYLCECGKVYKKNSKLILEQIKTMCELGGLDDHFHIDCECGLNLIVNCYIGVKFLSDKDKYKQNAESICDVNKKKGYRVIKKGNIKKTQVRVFLFFWKTIIIEVDSQIGKQTWSYKNDS